MDCADEPCASGRWQGIGAAQTIVSAGQTGQYLCRSARLGIYRSAGRIRDIPSTATLAPCAAAADRDRASSPSDLCHPGSHRQSQGGAPCEHLSAALAFGQWTAHVRSLSDTPCTLHTDRDSARLRWSALALGVAQTVRLLPASIRRQQLTRGARDRTVHRQIVQQRLAEARGDPPAWVTGRAWQHTGARSGAADRQGRARTDALRKGPAQGHS